MAKQYDLSDLAILVVEDNMFMAAILKTYLREFGVRKIVDAGDGADALEQVFTANPDLVIVDYNMPNFNGIEFARLVRTAPDSPNPRVPIIMVTAFSERRRIIEARDAGIDEILVKPVSAVDLYRRIIEVIERPREFTDGGSYVGPSRRRRKAEHDGPERRNTRSEAESA